MSISRVLIRFDIADHSPLPSVYYSAPSTTMPPKPKIDEKKTYANTVTVGAQPVKESLERCRGRRSPGPISVETHVARGPLPESDHVHQTVMGAADDSANHPESVKDTRECDGKVGTTDDDENTSKNVVRTSSSPELVSDSALESVVVEDGVDALASERRVRQKSHSPGEKSLAVIQFFSGNPMVETTEGIIHLYKDNQKTSLDEGVIRPDMLCMLAVPASMDTKYLMDFVAPAMPAIEQLKIIRDPTPNQFMVLVKFRTQKDADDFYQAFNNRRFNSIEPEICHLVYVAHVESICSSAGASFPVQGWTELPYCPVCLECMDESVDGILTVLCNHSFHGNCLSQWSDTTCPVCRYLQTPETVADNVCMQCESPENLWICLICGHVGCGRYQGGHARRHYEDTQHTYSMELGNNRVWDYAGDNYVHRLVQNKGDGKLVEVGSEQSRDPGRDEKFESITLEYTYLLTSQLESQRLYFEEKMAMIEQQALNTVVEVEFCSKRTREECEKLEHQLTDVIKEKQLVEKRMTERSARLTKVLRELQEEREMNAYLRENQKQWQEKVSDLEQKSARRIREKEDELREVNEQLRDIMVHLGAQNDLAQTGLATQDDIQSGQIFLPEAAAQGAGGRTRKKNKKSR